MTKQIGLGHSRALRTAAAKGRHGDSMLVHVSPEEWTLGAIMADESGDGLSINPETGLAEHFSFKKVLKGVAKAAAAAVGGYFGGPAGAAAGGLLASKALGDNWQTALTTSALSGLGAWGVQQTGLGDDYGGFSGNADLLGQQGGSAVLSGAAKYGLPLAAGAIGLSGLASSPKSQSVAPATASDGNAGVDWQGYKPLDRDQVAYQGPWDQYGQQDGEHLFFDPVQPPLVHMADGGKVKAPKKKPEPQYLENTPPEEMRYLYNDYAPGENPNPYIPPVKPPTLSMDADGNFTVDSLGYADGGEVGDIDDGPSMWLSGDRMHENYNSDRTNSAFADAFSTYGQTEQNDAQPERRILRLVTEFGMPEEEARSIVYGRMSGLGSTGDVQNGYAHGGKVVHMRVGGSMGAGDTNQGGGHGGPSGAGGSRTSSGSSGGSGGRLSSSAADHITAQSYGLSDKQYQDATTGLRNKVEDARDMGEGPLNGLGKMVLGLGGYYESDPSLNQTNAARAWTNSMADAQAGISRPVDSSAERMIDPFQAGATILGLATGFPVGTLYKGATMAFGRPTFGQINLGPSGPDVPGQAPTFGGMGSGGGTPPDPRSRDIVGTQGLSQQDGGLATLASNTATQGGAGNGAAPVNDQTPAGPGGRVFQPYLGDWSTYGQPTGTAEHGFWDPNPAPLTMAGGGDVEGMGDGQTDSIPAMLAPGEHVVDSMTVSAIGGGNNAEGHRRIEQLKARARKGIGLKNPKKAPKKQRGNPLTSMAA